MRNNARTLYILAWLVLFGGLFAIVMSPNPMDQFGLFVGTILMWIFLLSAGGKVETGHWFE